MVGNVKGKPAPDFELKTLDGKTVKLSDLRGKAVLLNFWATWCGPCKFEIPWFVDFQKQYGDQGLVIVGIASGDEPNATVEKFAKEMQINYPVLVGNDKVADSYGGVESLPTTFYISRDGKILEKIIGLRGRKEAEDNIKAALATQTASNTAGAR
jgi:cytochrome c biogenesis protein CcmG/thiol:disulfide interchange protein DsbE